MSADLLGPFLPIDRRHALASGAPLPEEARGAVALVDLSGFTALSEALRRAYGSKRAAEEITHQLNAVYTVLIAEVHRYGGSVIGFAGDCITCWFAGDDGRRGCGAALAMREALGATAPVSIPGGPTLVMQLKAVVGVGRVLRLGVGSAPRVEALTGALPARLGHGLEVAGADEVLIEAELAGALGAELETAGEVQAGALAFRTVVGWVGGDVTQPWPEVPALPVAALESWVPPRVAERLLGRGGELLAEVRPVVALFVRFSGFEQGDGGLDTGRLDAYINFVQARVGELDGDLVELTIGDKGAYLYIVFGAIVAHEDAASSAVRAAFALRDAPPDLGIAPPQQGISTGEMRVGLYGSHLRRGFGVQGQEVNVAARLMSRARPGQILVSGKVERGSRRSSRFSALGSLSLKSIEQPIPVYAAIEPRRSGDVGGLRVPATDLIGRVAERAAIERAIDAATSGAAVALVIEGPAGMGKSRLTAFLFDSAVRRGMRVLLGGAERIERARAFGPWISVFHALLDVGELAGPPLRDQLLARFAGLPEFAEHLALLNPVLPLEADESGATAGLMGKLRADRTIELLVELIRRARGPAPLTLVLEDAHWMDPLSLALLGAATALDAVIVATTVRVLDDVPGLAPLVRGATHLTLTALEPASTEALAARVLGVEALPEPLIEFLQARAEGHPLFTEELALALRESGVVVIEAGRCRLTRNLDQLDLPDTVQGVVSSRIDRLSAPLQLVLKLASVIGRVFPLRTLEQAYPQVESGSGLHAALKALEGMGITKRVEGGTAEAHRFDHALTREVVYSQLLSTQRRDLHQAVAQWTEEAYAADLAPHLAVLAYHWTQVARVDTADPSARVRAVNYLRQAAGQLTNIGMPRDAVTHGRDAVALLGVDLPMDPQAVGAEIAAGEGKVQSTLAGREPSALLGLPPMTDTGTAEIIDILLQVMPAAFMAQMPEFFGLAAITNMRLTVDGGHGPAAPVVYSMYAIIRRNAFGDLAGAHAFSRLALELDRRQGGHTFSVCAFIHGWFIDLWQAPLRESLPMSLDAGNRGLAGGDVLYGCFNLSGHVLYSAGSGIPLPRIIEVAREQRDIIAGRVLSSTFHCVLELQFAKALSGLTDHPLSLSDAEHDEARDLASIEQTDLYNQMAYYHVARLKLHLLFDEPERAMAATEAAFARLGACGGQVAEMEMRSYGALAMLRRADALEAGPRDALLARAREQVEVLRGWKAACAANFAHLADMAAGELARHAGDFVKAQASYSAAAEAADANGYLQYAALARELSARAHAAAGESEAAGAARQSAVVAWRRWGAEAKAAHLEAHRLG